MTYSNYHHITHTNHSASKLYDSPSFRTKAFSQIDNVVTTDQFKTPEKLPNELSTDARIDQIKKKYEKMAYVEKSRHLENYENLQKSYQGRHMKSTSTYTQNEYSYKNSHSSSKMFQQEDLELRQKPLPNQIKRQDIMIKRREELVTKPDFSNLKTEQLRRQLESNRTTISNMKLDLQTKLNHLNTTSSNSYNYSKKADEKAPLKREEISLTIKTNIPTDAKKSYVHDSAKEKSQRLLEELRRNKLQVSKAFNENDQTNKSLKKVHFQNKDQSKELSRITEISGSNRSESIKNSRNQLEDKIFNLKKDEKQTVNPSAQEYCLQEQNSEEISGSNLILIEPTTHSLIINKEVKLQSSQQAWYKNAASIYNEPSINNNTNDGQFFKKNDLKLERLQSTEGLIIKRTVTEQNIINAGKITRHVNDLKLYSDSKNAKKQEDIKERRDKYQKNSYQTKYSPLPKDTKPDNLKEKQSKDYKYLNKAYDEEMKRIDERIKMFEKNKLELNIEYKLIEPTKKESYKEIIQTRSYQRQKQANPENKYEKPNGNRSHSKASAFIQKTKPMYSDVTLKENPTVSSFAIKLIPVQFSEENSMLEESQSSYSQKSRIKQEYINKIEIEKRTDNGIEERKKKLQQNVSNVDQTKKLVKLLCAQAVKDQNFRNCKIWFGSYLKKSKWEDLKSELKFQKIVLTDSEIKEHFLATEAEHNPFFSVTDNKCDMAVLVKQFISAKDHWEENIFKKFRKDIFERENFISNKLDMEKKGFILVQDLVRFLNIQSGTFLRNRDLHIIFKRFSKGKEQLTFEQMLEVLLEK